MTFNWVVKEIFGWLWQSEIDSRPINVSKKVYHIQDSNPKSFTSNGSF